MALPSPADGDAGPRYVQLACEHLPDLLLVAQWLADDPQRVVEVTHASLSEGFRRFGEANGDLDFRAWVLGIMCDLCEVSADGGRELGVLHAGWCSQDCRSALEAVPLATLVRALPDWLRRPLVLCDIAGLSYRDIAGALRIPVGAVRSRIWRGRQALLRPLDAAPEAERRPPPCGLQVSAIGERGVPQTGSAGAVTPECGGG